MYGRDITVITDSSLLKHTLAFTGDDPTINRVLMKIRIFYIKVVIKPETFKALRFSKLLARNEDIRAQEQLDNLLQEFEKDIFSRKMRRIEEQPEVHLNLSKYKLNVFFDGACTRTKASVPIGTYGIVVQN